MIAAMTTSYMQFRGEHVSGNIAAKNMGKNNIAPGKSTRIIEQKNKLQVFRIHFDGSHLGRVLTRTHRHTLDPGARIPATNTLHHICRRAHDILPMERAL